MGIRCTNISNNSGMIVFLFYNAIYVQAISLFCLQINLTFLILSLRSLYRSKTANYRLTMQEVSQAKIVRYVFMYS